ncbi:MAG: DUF4054 domain-containing protein [bacterium]|nr:DUF4054 domain-containing protein [bacterium]
MSVTQIIEDIAPEFDTYDSDRIARLIVIAQSQLSSSKYGDQYEYATALKVCHMLTISGRSGSGGSISSEKEGELARSYGSAGSSLLSTTSYGLLLEELNNNSFIGAMTVKI